MFHGYRERLNTLSIPTFFDICAGTFLVFLVYTEDIFLRSVIFIFGIIFLMCLSLGIKPRDNYSSKSLLLASLLSFVGIFVHSFEIVPNSALNKFFNVSLMFEGFIYLFFGIYLLFLIINFSKCRWLYWAAIALSLLRFVPDCYTQGRVSFLLSFVIAFFIWLIINGKIKFAACVIAVGLIFTLFNWDWIVMKFRCRPFVWLQLVKDILRHPFIGEGYCKYLWGNMNWIKEGNFGWLYRHNDYLSLAAYIGSPVLPFLGCFLASSIKRIGRSASLIPFLTIAILCFFQMTMFYPDKAAVCLFVVGISLKVKTGGIA